ncbi:MAG TPA: hypothetical protein VK646_09450 [Actinomycetota bacterium]|nr:hypothetical protein [Actinomycetota bacterium]
MGIRVICTRIVGKVAAMMPARLCCPLPVAAAVGGTHRLRR